MLFDDLPVPTLKIETLPLSVIHAESVVPPDADLVASVKRVGILQPLIVRRNGKGFEVVDGLRRRAAAEMAQLLEVPVVIVTTKAKANFPLLTLQANRLRRANLLSEAQAILKLQQEGAAIEDICKATGLKKGEVMKRLRLAGLPQEIKASVAEGRTRMSIANAASKLPKTSQASLAEKAGTGEKLTGVDIDEIKTARRSNAVTGLQSLLNQELPEVGAAPPTSRRERVLAILRSGEDDEAKADAILALV